jgi:hypothetical protein
MLNSSTHISNSPVPSSVDGEEDEFYNDQLQLELPVPPHDMQATTLGELRYNSHLEHW